MFNAVHADAVATLMHIRKWLRILINRSLLLGTVDRPSVHDLVLDFAVAQHGDVELRERHRLIVDAFRAARPADAHGRRKFDNLQNHDPVAMYVCHEIEHHVSNGWQNDMEHDELVLCHWLTDVPQDPIVVTAGHVLGMERLSKLAVAAEQSKDWWLAARYWGVVQTVRVDLLGAGYSGIFEPTAKAIVAMEQLGVLSDPDKEDFQLALVGILAGGFDLSGDLSARPELVQQVLSSEAAARDPINVAVITLTSQCMPYTFAGDAEGVGKASLDVTLTLQKAAASDPDPVARAKCQVLAFNFCQCAEAMWIHPAFSWDAVYGPGGTALQQAWDSYDFDLHHQFLMSTLMADFFATWGSPVYATALHYGDLRLAYANFEKAGRVMQRILQEPNYQAEGVGKAAACQAWSHVVWSCRWGADRRETVHAFQVSCELTFESAEATVDELTRDSTMAWLRPKGNRELSSEAATYIHAAEFFDICTRCMSILMKRGRETDEEIMEFMLPTDEIAEAVTIGEMGCVFHSTHTAMNAFVSCAAVCELIGRPSEALTYTEAGLLPDRDKAGTIMPVARVMLLSMQARSLVALGRQAEAGRVFEAAAAEAHGYGLYLYEAFALRDLKLLVLDELSQSDGEHGSRRLGAALRLLTGPAELLTPLLESDALDAAELMALPPPNSAHEVVYEAEPEPETEASKEKEAPAVAALRAELEGMRLMALHRRAEEETGVDPAAIEDAMESDAPKLALVALLLAPHLAATAAAAESSSEDRQEELREELQALRLMALYKRANAEEGLDASAVEAAMESDDPKASLVALLLERLAAA
jgi:hypothetical protein